MDYNYYYKIIMAYTLVCTIHTVFVCHRKMLSTKLNSFSLKKKYVLVFQSYIIQYTSFKVCVLTITYLGYLAEFFRVPPFLFIQTAI